MVNRRQFLPKAIHCLLSTESCSLFAAFSLFSRSATLPISPSAREERGIREELLAVTAV